MIKRFKFLKVNFLNLDINNFDKIIKKKGLFVFPSGPGLEAETPKSRGCAGALASASRRPDEGC